MTTAADLAAYAAANDISPDWTGSAEKERRVLNRIAKLDKTPRAILRLARDADLLSDYWYWFTLGTLWVSYSGWSQLTLWRRLFRAVRANRSSSLMKPSELRLWEALPARFQAYRAHRPGESDWIAYTYDPTVAARFARERGVEVVAIYEIAREDVVAVFTRRGERELLVLDRERVKRIGEAVVVPL